MIILKIGGSALTDKKTGESYLKEVSRRVALEISRDKSFIIVHGVGYIGHKLAKEYDLHKGLNNNPFEWAHLRSEVKKMTKEIVSTLIGSGLSVLELSVTSLMRTSHGRIVFLDFEIIKEFVKRGFIPVLNGDGVLDDRFGLFVISGDKIVTEMAINLKADRIIYGTDVDGIFDENGYVIPEIDVNTIDDLKIKDNKDFSGGLKNKIIETKRLKGVDVKVINLRKDSMLKKAIENNSIGTTIRSN